MRSLKLFSLVVVLAVFFLLSGFQSVNADNVDWNKFSKNLEKALKSDNPGLRLSAMGMVIKYGEQLDVSNAVFDVVRIFRNSDNQKERQLALVTLYKMKHPWAMDFLKRHIAFEENEALKRQIQVIVYEYYQTDNVNVAAGK